MPVIRSAGVDDVAAILAIERQASAAAHWTPQQYEQLLVEGIILVAEEGAQLSGFICAHAIAGEWQLENVAVAAGSLRHGVAGELFRELIDRAKSLAASAIQLEVRDSNLPARGLYEKLGFNMVGRRRGYYQGPVEDAVLYTLQLG
jgi:ribosomal-protein-alanine N-acetyltransferase